MEAESFVKNVRISLNLSFLYVKLKKMNKW